MSNNLLFISLFNIPEKGQANMWKGTFFFFSMVHRTCVQVRDTYVIGCWKTSLLLRPEHLCFWILTISERFWWFQNVQT